MNTRSNFVFCAILIQLFAVVGCDARQAEQNESEVQENAPKSTAPKRELEYTKNSEIIAFLGNEDLYPIDIAVNPVQEQILVIHANHTVSLYSTKTGEKVKTFPALRHNVSCISFMPSGREFLTGSKDKVARKWDVESGKCLTEYKSHSELIKSVSSSLDGKRVLTCSSDSTNRVFDAESGRLIKQTSAIRGNIEFNRFDKSGTKVLALPTSIGITWKSPQLWDLQTNQIKRISFDVSETRTYSPHFASSTSGHLFAIAAETGKAKEDHVLAIVNVKDGSTKWMKNYHRNSEQVQKQYLFSDIAFSPNDKLVVFSGEKLALLFNVETGALVKLIEHNKRSNRPTQNPVGFSGDSNCLITQYEYGLGVWNLQNNSLLRIPAPSKGVLALEIANSKTGIVVNKHGDTLLKNGRSNTEIFSIQTGKRVCQIQRKNPDFSANVNCVTLSPSGKIAFLGYDKKSLGTLHSATTGAHLQSLVDKTRLLSFQRAVFSNDESNLATQHQDGTLREWDVESGKLVRILPVSGFGLSTFCYSLADDKIYVATSSRQIISVDLLTGKTLQFTSNPAEQVNSIGHLSKSTLFTSTKNKIYLWDKQNRNLVQSVGFEDGEIQSVFSDANRNLYVISSSGITKYSPKQ